MTKPIEQYTVDELSTKIKAIKAEMEKTESALKRYEEELEQRKQKVSLGVPLEDQVFSSFYNTYRFYFASEESQSVFDIRLHEYLKALRELAKGESIDIKVLLPLLKKGWVAYDNISGWTWYATKPVIETDDNGDKYWCLDWNIASDLRGYTSMLKCFNLEPADDWKTSLMECGL